jgi:hypothetical protein
MNGTQGIAFRIAPASFAVYSLSHAILSDYHTVEKADYHTDGIVDYHTDGMVLLIWFCIWNSYWKKSLVVRRSGAFRGSFATVQNLAHTRGCTLIPASAVS